MADQNIILISSIKVDNYVRSFFKNFGSIGYEAKVAKEVEKAMFDYFNNYLPKNQVKKFRLERYGLSLKETDEGKVFAKIGFENETAPADSFFEAQNIPPIDETPLLAKEKGHINFI